MSASSPVRTASTMSALTNSTSEERSALPRLVLRPELRSSRPITACPSARRRSTSVDPMNPAAPVTIVRIGSPYRRPLCALDLPDVLVRDIGLQLVDRGGVLFFLGAQRVDGLN